MLVDADDRPIGLRDKQSCHMGRGALHRAVSVFLFDKELRLLLQQRQSDKLLWGGYWSNSCCTHPFFNEAPHAAAQRRVREELGLNADLEFVYKFEYRAEWKPNLCEHELCSVFVGVVATNPVINETEIQAWRWISPELLDAKLAEDSSEFSPWLKLEWAELRSRGFPRQI